MWIKVERVEPGLHPDEAVVIIGTIDGSEELVVNRRSIQNNSLDIGFPIARRGTPERLVELPAETSSGAWRVWVDESRLTDGALEAAE